MGAWRRFWIRLAFVGAGVLVMAGASGSGGAHAPGAEAGPVHATPLEELVGAGEWGWRLACVGCVGGWFYLGAGSPALMIYMAMRVPGIAEACTIACLEAIR